MFRDVIQARAVLWNLALREIRVRYKQSYMGIAWALFLPLAMMLTFTFVFTRVINITDQLETAMPYAIFAYIGLLPWTFFTQSVGQATNSLVANRNLVTKIYFPREVLPMASIVSCLFDFCVAAFVLVGLIAGYHWLTAWDFELKLAAFWVLPVFLVQLTFITGLALWLSLANLFYRDVKYLVAVGLQLGMFLTNVIYPLQTDHVALQALINANPMTPIIDAYRRCLIQGQAPAALPFLCATFISVSLLISGWWFFDRTEPKFAESI
jgi:ABC-type polysaccharide/polyol phosphate export permease